MLMCMSLVHAGTSLFLHWHVFTQNNDQVWLSVFVLILPIFNHCTDLHVKNISYLSWLFLRGLSYCETLKVIIFHDSSDKALSICYKLEGKL